MLILNDTDILQAIAFDDMLISAEKALLLQESGDYYMPDRSHLHYEGNVQLLMPAFANEYFATKLVSVFPGNRKLNKPTIYGTVVLNDGSTGEPLALLNGSKLTALRTAAVGALGLAYTSPVGLETLGLIGAGVQGYHQVVFACVVRNIKRVGIMDPYHPDLKKLITQFKKYLPDIQFDIYGKTELLLQNSEAIITATTSLEPVLPNEPELLAGKHFIGIGSFTPEMTEYPECLYQLTKQVFIDTALAMKESGDISIPLSKGIIEKEQIHTLGKALNNSVSVDTSGTTLFKSVGMALFDLIAAETIYQRAIEKGLGQEVNF